MTVANKDIVRRWLDEMGSLERSPGISEFLDSEFICHEPGGTWTAASGSLERRLMKLFDPGPTAPGRRRYSMVAEGDNVAVLGAGLGAEERPAYHWVQVFRVHDGRLAETWFPGYVRDVDWGPLPAEPQRHSGAEEANKHVVRRWWDEMYAAHRFDELMPALAGPEYIRHEPTGTWTATITEHLQRIKAVYQPGSEKPRPRFSYGLLAEGDKVAGFGTMRGYRGGVERR